MRVIPRGQLEAIAGEIAAVCHFNRVSAQYRIVTEWRAKLEEPPTSLAPYQIDQIMREVQDRLKAVR